MVENINTSRGGVDNVTIDVGKSPKDPDVTTTRDGYTYYLNGHHIAVKVNYNDPSEGYKKCTHRFLNEKHVSSIKCRGEKQDGFNKAVKHVCQDVVVYLWEHDEHHLVPLLIAFCSKSGVACYKRDSPDTNSWKKTEVKISTTLSPTTVTTATASTTSSATTSGGTTAATNDTVSTPSIVDVTTTGQDSDNDTTTLTSGPLTTPPIVTTPKVVSTATTPSVAHTPSPPSPLVEPSTVPNSTPTQAPKLTIKELLDKMSADFKTFILKVDADAHGWKYRINGQNDSPFDINVMMTVHENDVFEYKKFVHTYVELQKPVRFLSTRRKDKHIPFEDSSLYKGEYLMASIYYWTADKTHKRPLLLELYSKDKNLTYYVLNYDSSEWEKMHAPKLKIGERLDLQNCGCNNVHVVDLSKTPESTTNYFCSSCRNNNIVVMCYTSTSCKYYRHRIGGHGKISKFTDGTNEQGGFEPMPNINEVFVHCYPSSNGRPLLVHIPTADEENQWYKRDNINNNIWKKVEKSKLPKGEDDVSKIIALMLDSYSLGMTLNLTYTPDMTSGHSLDYSIGSEKFTLTKEIGKDSTKFTHRRVNGPFRLYRVVCRDHEVYGFPSTDVLDAVCVYFWPEDTNCLRALVVETLSHSGARTYYRETKDHQTWEVVPRSGDKSTEINKPLLKAIMFQIWNKDVSSSAAIITAGVFFGILLFGVMIHEGISLVSRPGRSLILRLTGGWKRFD
ncbi:hypothetical protein BEWA_054410 [Theileria equi strain WA]|uniref:Uncharacterized protein n=1 Tax=Theileria equi strain WA TaxID=1537102 RepID=L1LDR1_THEEQ|nr:hypothetical protein BEWA_054410 [Theileria equi strain WA]EKX73385.1 hypothetical protein BEWA_054410 [Theileria equi strain WA]|eukprot:XP_004832837.1 hypothetical protein BEWA_054410 [Theileria equi strain WA]